MRLVGHTDMTAAPVYRLDAEMLAELRQVLGRPDLDDETLCLCLESDSDSAGLSLDEFKAGLGTPVQRGRLIRSLPVPPPRFPMMMPDHDLCPPRTVRAGLLRKALLALSAVRTAELRRAPLSGRKD